MHSRSYQQHPPPHPHDRRSLPLPHAAHRHQPNFPPPSPLNAPHHGRPFQTRGHPALRRSAGPPTPLRGLRSPRHPLHPNGHANVRHPHPQASGHHPLHHANGHHPQHPADGHRAARRGTDSDMDRFLVANRTGKRPPSKTIFLVRHGESTHNAHSLQRHGADLNDVRYLDAPLTQQGVQQARSIAPEIPGLHAELVVTSPLTRASQTCLYAIEHMPRPTQLLVHPLCIERLAYACDIGSPVSELEKRFPMLDYGRVRPKDAWWWTPPSTIRWGQMDSLMLLRRYPPGAYKDVEPTEAFRKRADDFRLWLLERPEKRIVVFAHGIFLTTLMGEGSERFRNAEIKKWIL